MSNNEKPLRPGYRRADAKPAGYLAVQQRDARTMTDAHRAALEMEARNEAGRLISKYAGNNPEYLALLAINLADQSKAMMAKRDSALRAEQARQQPRHEETGRWAPRNGEPSIFDPPEDLAAGIFGPNTKGRGGF